MVVYCILTGLLVYYLRPMAVVSPCGQPDINGQNG